MKLEVRHVGRYTVYKKEDSVNLVSIYANSLVATRRLQLLEYKRTVTVVTCQISTYKLYL